MYIATRSRYGGIFYYCFTANLPLKIGQYLVKLGKNIVAFSLHGVYYIAPATTLNSFVR